MSLVIQPHSVLNQNKMKISVSDEKSDRVSRFLLPPDLPQAVHRHLTRPLCLPILNRSSAQWCRLFFFCAMICFLAVLHTFAGVARQDWKEVDIAMMMRLLSSYLQLIHSNWRLACCFAEEGNGRVDKLPLASIRRAFSKQFTVEG